MFAKLKLYIKAHKIISILVTALLVGGGYYAYRGTGSAAAVTKYVVQNATVGSVVSSVSGTGQVQAGTTINVSAKVSEPVTSIPVRVGQHVSQGQTLLQLDSTNEARAERSAELSLESAQLALAQLQQITTSTLLQDQNAARQAQADLDTANASLAQDYESGFDSLGATFVNMQNVIAGLQAFTNGNDLNKNQSDPDAYLNYLPTSLRDSAYSYRTEVQSSFTAARAAYNQNLTDYHAATRDSSEGTLDALFSETYKTAGAVSDAVRASKSFLDYVVNEYGQYYASSSSQQLPPITTTFQTNFSNYTNTMATTASGVQSTITGIVNDRNTIANNQASLAQASETLLELTAGPTATQLLSAQINVQSAQNSLETAQENLADTSVRAPIAGTVSAITATVGETPGTSPVTIVGDGEVAQVTLNEIDAAKVQVGDKATLTFDAISGLSLAGQVAEIDPVGTVSQGVVSYNVQVGFSQPADTTSSMQVKPGMSVTADIVTQVAQNVIAVPNAAVITQGGASYILEPAAPLSAADIASSSAGIELAESPKMVPITVGISNDTMTAITSGVNEGDQIIVQTVKSSTGSSGSSGASSGGTNALRLLGGGGGTFGGGGGQRISTGGRVGG